MLSHADFTDIQLQGTIFTTGLNFQNGPALTLFLAKWPEHFTNIVFAGELPGAPPEIPRLVLQSANSRYKLQAGPARLDLFRVGMEPQDPLEISAFFEFSCLIFDAYLMLFRGIAGRAVGMITRAAAVPHPAETISTHFLKSTLIQGSKALEGLADMELNLAVSYALGGCIQVTDWLRCRSGIVARQGPTRSITSQTSQRPQVFVVQEIISNEDPSVRKFSTDQLRDFFALLPESFAERLALVFPRESVL